MTHDWTETCRILAPNQLFRNADLMLVRDLQGRPTNSSMHTHKYAQLQTLLLQY